MRVIRNQTFADETDFALPLNIFRSWQLLLFWTQWQMLCFNESIHLFISKSDKTQTGLQLWKTTKYLTAFIKCQHGTWSGSSSCPAGRWGWLGFACTAASFASVPPSGLCSREVSHHSQVIHPHIYIYI